MVVAYWGGCCYRGYSWKLSIVRLRVSVRRKERKYSLIWPFWLDTRVEAFIWREEMDFGRDVSSQVRSSRSEAIFWPRRRFIRGRERWIIAGKYPRRFENLYGLRGVLNFRLCVAMLRSRAIMKPVMVTSRAVIFKWKGMVICGIFIGVRLLVRRKPAKMLPIRRRLIEFIRWGLFSLIRISVGKRGCPRRAKKMIRVL